MAYSRRREFHKQKWLPKTLWPFCFRPRNCFWTNGAMKTTIFWCVLPPSLLSLLYSHFLEESTSDCSTWHPVLEKHLPNRTHLAPYRENDPRWKRKQIKQQTVKPWNMTSLNHLSFALNDGTKKRDQGSPHTQDTTNWNSHWCPDNPKTSKQIKVDTWYIH